MQYDSHLSVVVPPCSVAIANLAVQSFSNHGGTQFALDTILVSALHVSHSGGQRRGGTRSSSTTQGEDLSRIGRHGLGWSCWRVRSPGFAQGFRLFPPHAPKQKQEKKKKEK